MKIFKNLFRKKSVIKKLFLIAKGRASTEGSGGGFDRYTGVGIVNILGVNPSKEELSEIQGREITSDPIYVYPQKDANDTNMVRIVFPVKTTDHDINSGIDVISQISFILRDQHLTSDKSGEEKVKVIDNYGQTSWVTEAQLKAQERPLQRNGKRARILPPFRPMYLGEEELIDFLKKFMNIPEATNYDQNTGEWVPSSDIDDAQIALGDMAKYFEGDVAELKQAISALPENYVKVLFYVRTNDENKSYQSVLSDLTLRPGSNNHEAFLNKIKERKEYGAFEGCIFTYGPLELFNVSPTSFTAPTETPEAPKKWFN